MKEDFVIIVLERVHLFHFCSEKLMLKYSVAMHCGLSTVLLDMVLKVLCFAPSHLQHHKTFEDHLWLLAAKFVLCHKSATLLVIPFL